MEVSAVAGRIASSPLFAGQTIYDGQLAPRGAARGLSAMVPPGMRAITIDVNETSGLAGMLAPGCHVDAMSIIANGDAKATSAQVVVQNVLVQAVGQKLSNARPAEEGDPKKEVRNDNYRSVTLIVTPRQAASIQLASSNTRMTLVLRGAGDIAASDEGSVTIADLLGSAQAVPATPAPQIQPTAAIVPVAEVQRRYVELIKGTNAPVRVEFREAPHALPMNAATDTAPATEIDNDGTQQ
jgi:pilus assembly protein CpaB